MHTLAPSAILFDVESRSRLDLKIHGARNYWAHPSTEVLCVAWYDTDAPDQGIQVWEPGDPAPAWAFGGRVVAAHNGLFFDRYALARIGWTYAELIDTSHLSRRAGMPGSLDALGKKFGHAKDKAASRFTVGLSSARRPTKRTAHLAPGREVITPEQWRGYSAAEKRLVGVLPELTPEVRARVRSYCQSDVSIMVESWPWLLTHLVEWPDWENEVMAVSDSINDRGIQFDTDLARRLLGACEANTAAALQGFADELGTDSETLRAVVNSPAQFTAMTGAPDATKTTVADMISGAYPCDEISRTLARARDATASIAAGKLTAGLALQVDGWLYDTLVYGGAHPGRWSGRGMQLQNLPRPDKEMEERIKGPEDVSDLVASCMTDPSRAISPAEIDVLLRATLWAGPGNAFAVGDYSGVESRMLAWIAGDQPELDRIAAKVDPYKALAEIIYRVPYAEVTKIQRSAGKIGVLACGYGGGKNALQNMAASSGVDFAGAGTTPQAVVDAWRAMHPAIVDLWHECEDAFLRAYRTGAGAVESGACVGRIVYLADGANINLILPSGRPMVYRDVRLAKAQKFGRTVQEITYASPAKGGARVGTYGGKLVENLIQAACRCIMAWAMVQAERAGLAPVLTVHDELVNVIPATRAAWGEQTLRRIMGPEGLDKWAEGFPVGCETWVGERYMK